MKTLLSVRAKKKNIILSPLPTPGAGSQAKRNSNFKGVRKTTCGTVIPVMTRGIEVWYEDLSDIISAQDLLQLLSK